MLKIRPSLHTLRAAARFGMAAACAFLAAAPAGAQQPAYPNKLVRVVVPLPPGGGTDILARTITQALSTRLGQPAIVDNRSAAAGIVGTEYVARAPADGHTLLFMTSAFVIVPGLHAALPYDPLRDFAPVARLSSVPHVLVTHPSLPVRSVADLVALAKSRPGQINFASQSSGSSSQLSAEMFKMAAGVQMTHIPYKGAGLAVTALVSGEVSVLFSVPAVAQPHIESGRLRLLAVTSGERSRLYPQTPTMRESGIKNFEALQWHGVWAPAATPAAVVERLNTELNSIITFPPVVERMRAEGADPMSGTPRAFAQFIASEMAKWAEVIRVSGARLE